MLAVEPRRPSLVQRILRILHPSHEHSMLSATALTITMASLASLLSLGREVYIAWAFGAGLHTDAFVAAFTFPDLANYIFAGGTASVAFTAMLAHYGPEEVRGPVTESFSVVMTIVSIMLFVLLGIAALFIPQFIHFWFPQFGPEEAGLCIYMTRIVFPMQIFAVVGGVLTAVLRWRRQFMLPSLQPVIMSGSVIVAALIFSRRYGIVPMAWGAVIGSFLGNFLLSLVGAWRVGLRYRFIFNLKHPAFREWFRLSVPLMFGASLLFVDDPFIRHFAAGVPGDITRLSYAKRLFMTVMMIGVQGTGPALMVYFADLFANKRMREFQAAVGESIYRSAIFSLLISGWLFATSLPVIDLVFRSLGGRFHFSDSLQTSAFLGCFVISLVFWIVQSIYTRAFFAASDTMTPTIITTVVTIVAYPVYAGMFRAIGVLGLPLASDICTIFITIVMAISLSRKKLFPMSALAWRPLMIEGGVLVAATLLAMLAGKAVPMDGSRVHDLESLGIISCAWLGISLLGLHLSGSRFLADITRRIRTFL